MILTSFFHIIIQLLWFEPIADVVYLSADVCRKYDELADGEEQVVPAFPDVSLIKSKTNGTQSLTKIISEKVINIVEDTDKKEVEKKGDIPQVNSSSNARQGCKDDLKTSIGGTNMYMYLIEVCKHSK